MQILGELLGILDTIICVVSLHCHSCNHGIPLKLHIGHDGFLSCKGDLMMHTDFYGFCIK